MPRRPFRKRKSAGLPPQKRRSTGRGPATDPLQLSVLRLLAARGVPLTAVEIAHELHLGSGQLPILHTALAQLLDGRKIDRKGKRFSPAVQPEQLRATLDLTSKGFGFAILEGERA